jgi:hypothetical protein
MYTYNSELKKVVKLVMNLIRHTNFVAGKLLAVVKFSVSLS